MSEIVLPEKGKVVKKGAYQTATLGDVRIADKTTKIGDEAFWWPSRQSRTMSDLLNKPKTQRCLDVHGEHCRLANRVGKNKSKSNDTMDRTES